MINKWLKTIKNSLKRSLEEKDIDMKQLEILVKQGAILIDVRSMQEYNEGHMDGAICIPSYEIETKIESKIKNKEDKIILYCDSGGRSKKAQKILEKMGYVEVYNLYKGTS